MSLIIRVKNADFSASGLPQLEQTIYGLPADGLVGLYLFESGSDDAVHNGPFTDYSGSGNHASIYGDWVAPIKRAYGLEVTDEDGLAIDTGIAMSGEFTVIACLKSTLPASASNVYETHVADTGSITTSKDAGNNSILRPVMNTQVLPDNTGNFGIFGGVSASIGPSRVGGGGDSRQASIYGFGVSASQTLLKTRSLDGTNYNLTDADLATDYGGDLSGESIVVGGWGYGAYRPATSELYAFAVYDRLLADEQFVTAIAAINQRVTARGVTIFT